MPSGPAAAVVCVVVHGPCYHKESQETCLLKSEGLAESPLPHWLWEIWPHPSLDTTAIELVPLFTPWSGRAGSRRASSAPYLRGLVSVVQINHLSSHPDPHPGPCAGPSSHLPYPSPAGACEGTGPVKRQLENLHVQEQHQDICGDLWWRSSDGTANIWTM